MKLKIATCVLLSFFVFMSQDIFAQTDDGTIELEIKYNNGDRVDFYETEIKVYKNSETEPQIKERLASNPYTIEQLSIGTKYKIEVYVNNILADTLYVNLQSTLHSLESIIPLSGGLQVSVFFNDGYTPIKDARVVIKSQDDTVIREGTTNNDGATLRYWIQSTTQTEHYLTDNYYYNIDVYMDDIPVASDKKINIQPGLTIDQKIVATIPPLLEDLITITVYKADSQPLEKTEDVFKIILYDKDGNLAYQSSINPRNNAHFSNIKPGEYQAVIVNKASEPVGNSTNLTIIGTQNDFSILLEEDTSENTKDVVNTVSCNCVAFRLDDIQDYWLNDVQIQIIKQFSDKNIPLTIGIIGNAFGSDQKITSFIKDHFNTYGNLEIANHGLGNEPMAAQTKNEQVDIISKANEHIISTLGVKPTIFIPPQNRFNEDTVTALKETGMTHISSSLIFDKNHTFPLEGEVIYRFPETATTGQYDDNTALFVGMTSDETFAQLQTGLEKYGFAVVTMHPQEFSTIKDGVYVNEINLQQIEELDKLLDKIVSTNLKVVPIGKINLDSGRNVPDWIKNNAAWWANGQIDNTTFVSGIEFLIKNKIITVQDVPSVKNNETTEIPDWVKNNAAWWAQNLITEKEFLNGIEFLISSGIVKT